MELLWHYRQNQRFVVYLSHHRTRMKTLFNHPMSPLSFKKPIINPSKLGGVILSAVKHCCCMYYSDKSGFMFMLEKNENIISKQVI